jgi:TatD DNase family protein
MYSESHCHFRAAGDEAYEKAVDSGVELVLTAGIDVASTVEAVDVACEYNIIKACVGIHPWYADEYNEENHRKLRVLADNEEVVAVSEIGLDYAGRMTRQWERSSEVINHEVQRAAFRGQIALAKELGLPILVHDRAHGQELLDILQEEDVSDIGAAIHGFTKDAAYARRAVEMGVYLSIGRSILREENQPLADAIAETPLDWLLTETDSGDPSGVILVAEKIAEIKGLTKEEVGLAATRNLRNLLGL